MNLKQLLQKTPRLREWSEIGPVQAAELHQFVEHLFDKEWCAAITCDGEFVHTGDRVWVLNGVGTPTPTTVRELQAYTTYDLFGPVPVAHSWSTEAAAHNYRKHS